jgi:hypothetical protein
VFIAFSTLNASPFGWLAKPNQIRRLRAFYIFNERIDDAFLKTGLVPFVQPAIFSSASRRCKNKFHANIMEILAKTSPHPRRAWKLLI